MRIILRRKRCVSCKSLNTRKHGFIYRRRSYPDRAVIKFVRWLCSTCKKTFSHTNRVTPHRAKRATELYFDAKASYRNTAKVLGTHRMTAYVDVQTVCRKAKAPLELSLEHPLRWSGYLLIDSNTLNVFNAHEQLLAGVDAITRDIPNAILVRTESAANWAQFLTSFRDDLSYPIKAVVSDGDPVILRAVKDIFPDVPHQMCVRHFEQDMFRYLRYRPHRPTVDMKRTRVFMYFLHRVLYSSTLDEYLFSLDVLRFHPVLKHPDFKDAISNLERHYSYLTPRFSDTAIPRTTNIIENVFSQLDTKFNPIVKFRSHETAWNTAKLLISWYRFKQFSSCKKRYADHNGKSPLELAGALTQNAHWISQAIRPL